jgi:hypothetical protein
MRPILAYIKRRHHAYWVDVRYLTPFGRRCWAVCITSASEERELARSGWLVTALYRAALTAPSTPHDSAVEPLRVTRIKPRCGTRLPFSSVRPNATCVLPTGHDGDCSASYRRKGEP